MFTLSQKWRRRLGLESTPRQGRRSTTRPWLEALEERYVPSTTGVAPASGTAPAGQTTTNNGGPTTAPTQTTTGAPANNNGGQASTAGQTNAGGPSPTFVTPVFTGTQIAPLIGAPGMEQGTVTGVAGLFPPPTTPTGSVNLGVSGTTGLGQNQPGQARSALTPSVFPFFATTPLLGSGLPSPGVPFGFTGRVAFANTGTPERTAYGPGDLSPNSGVVPTGLYLNSGGGDNAMLGAAPPVRPAPPPVLPLPAGMAALDSTDVVPQNLPELTAAEQALSSFLAKP